MLSTALFGKSLFASQFLNELPADFQTTVSKWAWISYDSASVAVIPGSFNRSVLDAPHNTKVSDDGVAEAFVPDDTVVASFH